MVENKSDKIIESQGKLQTALEDLDTASKAINEQAKAEPAPTPAKQIKVEDKTPTAQPIKVNTGDQISDKLLKFMVQTDSIKVINAGTPDEKYHPTAAAWDYLARLKGCHTEIQQCIEGKNEMDTRVAQVVCEARLVRDSDQVVLSKGIGVVCDDEPGMSRKPLNTLYAVAQNRAKIRAIQAVFESYMAQAKVALLAERKPESQPVPTKTAREVLVDMIKTALQEVHLDDTAMLGVDFI